MALAQLIGAYGALDLKERALWIPAGLVVVAAVLVMRSPAQSS